MHRGTPRQERSRWGTKCAHVFPKPSTSLGTDVEAITLYAGLRGPHRALRPQVYAEVDSVQDHPWREICSVLAMKLALNRG